MDQLAAWIDGLPLWAVYLALGVIALLTSRKSQFDSWVKSSPRLAGSMKLLRGFAPDYYLIRQAVVLLLKHRLPADVPPAPKRKSLPPGVGALLLALSCGLIVASPVLLAACSATQAQRAQMVESGKALAFNSAVTALVLLDRIEAERIDAIKNPTEAQVAEARKNVTKLRAARDALQLVREWMLGQSNADGPKLIRESLETLQSVVMAIEAEGGQVPPEVEEAIQLGSFYL